MCRLLGIVASEPTEFRLVLREVPRSLATLSQQHPDGWGLAVYNEDGKDWAIKKGTATAHTDDAFHDAAAGSRGVLLLSHIRLKTVGPTSLHNTHPFESDGWVFAHNGTITDVDFMREQVSEVRRAGVKGDTDSELFFAWMLTELDAAGLTRTSSHVRLRDGATLGKSDAAADEVVKSVVAAARKREKFGAFNFLLSNGRVTYAHRFGRTLFVLRRGPHDQVRPERTSEDGATVYTPWSQRRHAVFIASERMTDEPWEELPDGTLVRIDRVPIPTMKSL